MGTYFVAAHGGALLWIHFTSEDLARVRVAHAPDPLWDTVLSLRTLGQQRAEVGLETWRRHTLGRLTPPTRRLRALVSSSRRCPDFLTPTRGGVSPEHAVTQMLATSPSRIRAELAALGGTAAWAVALGDADGSALHQLGQAMLSYFCIGLAPYWLRIHAAVDGERARLARILVDGGIERLLVGLWPDTSWRPPVLRVPYPANHELVLAGRDLVLLPSLFCPQPMTRQDPALPPVLVFPVRSADRGSALRPPTSDPAEPTPDCKLAALLGRTRAAVLETVASPCTTSELARRAGISLASASQHATVLREAGLLTTTRHRNAVLHTTAALGAALLDHP